VVSAPVIGREQPRVRVGRVVRGRELPRERVAVRVRRPDKVGRGLIHQGLNLSAEDRDAKLGGDGVTIDERVAAHSRSDERDEDDKGAAHRSRRDGMDTLQDLGFWGVPYRHLTKSSLIGGAANHSKNADGKPARILDARPLRRVERRAGLCFSATSVHPSRTRARRKGGEGIGTREHYWRSVPRSGVWVLQPGVLAQFRSRRV
jgi:hypothetical protein